ncbi:twin-arginine translocation signal domain-containing protein [Aeromonas veronii]
MRRDFLKASGAMGTRKQ